MAGRRLSSNDITVVIALAIVVLVLLLIYVAERGSQLADEPGAAVGLAERAVAAAPVSPPVSVSPDADARDTGKEGGCGLATPVAGQTQLEADAVVDRQRDEALQSILAALQARPEPRARAAALYFRATRHLVETPGTRECTATPEACLALARRRLEDGESAEALARLAVNHADPQVYAWAYQSCAKVSRSNAGTCQLVNAPQWARLDPANAVPWLAVAREARSRKDGAGLDDAMFHVAAAGIHDPGWGRGTAQMIEAAPEAERTTVGTWLAALSAISLEALDDASFTEASTYCDARLLGNANRRDTCDKIATLFVQRSTTLLARVFGIGLAKRLDWPVERFAGAEQERDADDALDAREALPAGVPVDCASIRRDVSRLLDVARLGEVEVSRRRIAATGAPIGALAAETRRSARSLRQADAAQAAASAASVATGG